MFSTGGAGVGGGGNVDGIKKSWCFSAVHLELTVTNLPPTGTNTSQYYKHGT